MAEWLKASVSKTDVPFGYLGFESLPLRHIGVAMESGNIAKIETHPKGEAP